MATPVKVLRQHDQASWQKACHKAADYEAGWFYAVLAHNYKECRTTRKGCCATKSRALATQEYQTEMHGRVSVALADLATEEVAKLHDLSVSVRKECMKGALTVAVAMIELFLKLHCCRPQDITALQTNIHKLLEHHAGKPTPPAHPVTRSHIKACVLCERIHENYKRQFPDLKDITAMPIDETK